MIVREDALNEERPAAPVSTHTASTALPAGLPAGSELERIAFVSARSSEHDVVLEFPAVIQRRAVLVNKSLKRPADDLADDVEVLTIPAVEVDDAKMLEEVQAWVEVDAGEVYPKSHMMTLQGARIYWSRGRIAIFAAAGRLATIRAALLENVYYDRELRDLEKTLGESWPQLEADLPLACEFGESSLGKRKQVLERFKQVLTMRARLARITPYVNSPHLHPATLASQIEDRFRERTRMTHRHEFLHEQLEVFDKVYDTCTQRAGDYMLARSGHILEWIIIVLLGAQIVFTVFEYLTSVGAAQ